MLLAWALLLAFGDGDPKPLSFYGASDDEILAPMQQESLKDLERRAKALTDQAAAARQAGDDVTHRRLMAEASWLWAEAKEARGDFAAAEKFRQEAVNLGYQPPVHAPHPMPQAYDPRITPPMMPAGPAYVTTLWDFFKLAPYPSMRNNSWFALIGIPPMEQAATLPMSEWDIRASFDFSTTNWSDTSGGGKSFYNGRLTEENLQADFGVTPFWQAGVRVTTGELLASSASRLVVFKGGAQLVHRGQRSFDLESIVLRSKISFDVPGFTELGILNEFKMPLDNRHSLLSSGSFDSGTSILMTNRWGILAFHVNLGGVFPLGDAYDIFRSNKRLDPFFTYGAAVDMMLNERIVAGLQLEGNTGTFGQLPVLNDNPVNLLAFGRFEINPDFYVDASIGAGFTDLSSDLTGSIGITWAY